MGFRFQERPGSGNSTYESPTRELLYYAAGSTNTSFIESYAIGATPYIINSAKGTLYRQDIKIDWQAAAFAHVTIPYAPRDNQTGSYKIDFDTTGGTVTVKASKQTVGVFPAGAPDHGGLIGVHGDDVDGAAIVIPALKMSVSFKHPAGVITIAQMKALARNTGKVAASPFLTFSPGEVLFLGATGSDGSDAEAEIRYQFAMSENAEGLTIGGIADIVKKGHDVAWIAYNDAVDGGDPVKRPAAVYVERVYETVNLAALLGFGA